MDESEVSPGSSPGPSPPLDAQKRPRGAGRQAEPTPATLLQAHRAEVLQQSSRPRNRSPYSRGHLRSYSAASALSAPPMARARSLPNPAAGSSLSPSHSPVRPSSPLRTLPTTRASPRRSFEDMYPQAATPSFMEIESIAEDSELYITPRPLPPTEFSPAAGTVPFSPSSSTPRTNNSGSSRRRPTSPLHSLVQSSVPSPPTLSSFPSTSTNASSPSAREHPSQSLTPPPQSQAPVSRFNETYPGATPTTPQLTLTTTTTSYSNSSVPSTPTSLRSRSPSISSLETIPDSPDAEEAAMEAFNIGRLKAAAEAAAESMGNSSGSGSDSDGEVVTRRSRTSAGGGGGSGPGGLGARSATTDSKSRKRWSVCGAERRGDFEMETIWED